MLAKIQRQRNPNGFVKQARRSYDLLINMSTTGFLYRFQPPALVKATSLDEWNTKLVSNRIRIIAVVIKLLHNDWMQNASKHVQSYPVAIDVLRVAQSEAYQNGGRIADGTVYLNSHSYQYQFSPALPITSYDIASSYNLPYDESKGFPKIYSRDTKEQSSLTMSSPLVPNTNWMPPVINFDLHKEVECVVEIPDDGNPLTGIPLDECIGELVEVFMVTCANYKNASTNQLHHQCMVVGEIQIIYQDIGTKLSHL